MSRTLHSKRKNLDFKQVYKFPLKLHYGKVHTADFGMAFDFDEKLSKERQQELVAAVNGGEFEGISGLTYKNSYVYLNEKPFLSIRGWGYLTGTGGLKLTEASAEKVQDDFGNFLIEKLSKKS